MHSAPLWVAVGIALLGCALACRLCTASDLDCENRRRLKAEEVLLLPGLALVLLGVTLAAKSGNLPSNDTGKAAVAPTASVMRVAATVVASPPHRVMPLARKRRDPGKLHDGRPMRAPQPAHETHKRR